MRRLRAPIYDRDGKIIGELDLTDAQWRGTVDEEDGQDVTEDLEVALVPHQDGVTYVAMRRTPPQDEEDLVLVYTPSEWRVFAPRAASGYFDWDAARQRHGGGGAGAGAPEEGRAK